MNIKIQLSSVIEYLIALIVILDCNSVWNNIRPTRAYFQYFLLGGLLIAILAYAYVQGMLQRLRMRRILIKVSFVVMYFLLFLVINNNNIINSVLNMAISIALFLVYFSFEHDENSMNNLPFIFARIMVVVSLISTILWIVGPVLGIIEPTGTYYTNWSGNNNEMLVESYFGIHFSVQKISFFDLFYIVRNTSFFNEAPMASLCFSLALMIEVLLKKEKSTFSRVILVIANLTTFSTSGYICIALIFVYDFIRNRPNNRFSYYLKTLCLPVGLAVATIILIVLVNEKMSTFSGLARWDDIVSGFRAWLINPIFGDGIGSVNAMRTVRPEWRRGAEGYNSGFVAVVVQGGIYIAVLYAYAYVKVLKNAWKIRDIDMIFFVLLNFLLFVITVVQYNYITLFLLCFFEGYVSCNEMIKKNAQKEEYLE